MAFSQAFASVIAGGDYHQTSSVQYHELGQKMELSDGRVFRYCQADGTGFAAGLILASPVANTANHTNANVAVANIGDRKVTITLGATAAAENLYAGGYFWVNDATGEGHVYTISGHAASAGGTTLDVHLREPLAIALAASGNSQCTLVSNPYKAVTIAAAQASLASRHVGVSPVAIAANGYGWVQTKGLASVLATTTGPTAFQGLISGAAGTGTVITAATELPVGFTWIAETASGDQCLVWLTLE